MLATCILGVCVKVTHVSYSVIWLPPHKIKKLMSVIQHIFFLFLLLQHRGLETELLTDKEAQKSEFQSLLKAKERALQFCEYQCILFLLTIGAYVPLKIHLVDSILVRIIFSTVITFLMGSCGIYRSYIVFLRACWDVSKVGSKCSVDLVACSL